MPAQQLLHHLTSRRHRVYGAIGVALTLLAAAFWIYGGFATGIDFSTSSPRPPDLAVPSSPKATPPVSSSPELAVPPPAANFPASPSPSPPPPPSPSPASPPPPVSPTPDLPSPSTAAASNTANGQGTNQHSAAADDAAAHPAQPTPGAAASIDTSQGIPPKIWQIVLPKKPSSDTTKINPQSLEDTPSWLAMNPDYSYTLVGQRGGEALVDKYFGSEPGIVEAYAKMPNVGMKSDLLRYLILSAEGGVYTDTDTIALRPVDEWIPQKFRGKVAVIVGIEFDKRDGVSWVDINHAVQFCQWTIAAVPGHKLFRAMVERALLSLKDLSAEHGVPIQELKPTSFEVMNSTGPAAFTDVVFAQLQEHGVNRIEDLSYMTEPRLYGDILVLTIDGFGMGQVHSHSTNDGTIPEAALVRHLFKGGWRGDKRKRVPAV